MRQGSVDLHGLQCRDPALSVGLDTEGAHIVQSVTQLDENDTDIFRHSKEHLAKALNMRLLLVLDLHHDDLGKSVHKHRHILSKLLAKLFEVGLVGAVLHRIVQKRRTNRIGIKAQTCDDLRHGDRVRDIGVATDAELPFMKCLCILVGTLYFFDIVSFLSSLQKPQQSIKADVHLIITHIQNSLRGYCSH